MGPTRFGPWVLFLLSLPFATIAPAQQTTPTQTSDPQAVALAAKAVAVLTGGRVITDVTLTGTAARTAGSDMETGTITLKALGPTNGRMDFSGAGGNRSEIRNSSTGAPQGAWIGADALSHPTANHNCFTDAVWFYPAFSILARASNTNVLGRYVGQETRGGESVQHLQFSGEFPNSSEPVKSLLTSLTTEDVYLDATSLLPVALAFNTHPDNDAGANIPVEIDFANYESVSGVQVPFSVQFMLNGTLFFSITIQSVDFNSGLSESAFATE